MNMLGKLEIHCEFKHQGCEEVVILENLNQHTMKCKYNQWNRKMKCKKCFCEYPDKSRHDCVEALLDLNRKANQEIEALKRSPIKKRVSPVRPTSEPIVIGAREESLQRDIKNLREEKENLLKTIQELTKTEVNSIIKSW